MAGEILVTMNKKALEAPELWECVGFLREKADLVSFTGSDPMAYRERISSALAWVCAGGDGTLNHVVSSLMAIPSSKRCPVFYIPYGTGNDFGRAIGLGDKEPLDILKEAFSPGANSLAVTVGASSGGHFVNMATGGLFATVTAEANPSFKSVAGRWAYFVNGIGKLLERDTVSISIDGAFPVKALGFFVANARFAGGGVQISAKASPFEPDLSFLLVPDMPTKDLLAFGLELQKEEPDLSSFPVRLEKVRKLRLDFDREVPINLDGEQVLLRSMEFSSQPEALRIFVPAQC